MSGRRKSTREVTGEKLKEMLAHGKEHLPPVEKRRKRIPGAKYEGYLPEARDALAAATTDALRATEDMRQVCRQGALCGTLTTMTIIAGMIIWYMVYGLFSSVVWSGSVWDMIVTLAGKTVQLGIGLVALGMLASVPCACGVLGVIFVIQRSSRRSRQREFREAELATMREAERAEGEYGAQSAVQDSDEEATPSEGVVRNLGDLRREVQRRGKKRGGPGVQDGK